MVCHLDIGKLRGSVRVPRPLMPQKRLPSRCQAAPLEVSFSAASGPHNAPPIPETIHREPTTTLSEVDIGDSESRLKFTSQGSANEFTQSLTDVTSMTSFWQRSVRKHTTQTPSGTPLFANRVIAPSPRAPNILVASARRDPLPSKVANEVTG